ncbi:amino acid transporter [Wallemia mellicola]|nr:amino acid transporter [Wallemia mellicola]
MDQQQPPNPTLQVAAKSFEDLVDTESGKANSDDKLQPLQDNFGYVQEMPRNRSMASILFLAVAIAAIPYGLSTTIIYPLTNGGPSAVIWGWVFMACVTQAVAISLAEICSRYPVAGGAYYWSYMLSPPKYARIYSYICGWVYLVGNWTVTLAVNFGTTQLFLAGLNILYPDFVANQWQTVLTFWALTIVTTLISCIPGKYLKYIDHGCFVWTVAGLITILVALSVRADAGRRTAAWVFGYFNNDGSGWPKGWSFFVGLLMGGYTLSSTAMISSMCEEVTDPEVVVPKAMIANIPLSFGTGLIFLLPLLFVMPDITTVLEWPTGQPVPAILQLAMGYPAGAFGLFFILFLIGIFSGIGCTTAASRLTWAFARDNAIPFSGIFKIVNKKLELPLNAILFSTAVQMVLGCVYFGSSAAFNAFSSVSVICLGCSNLVPITISFFEGRNAIADARFNMGKIGAFCNVVAILWFSFAIPLFCFPTTTPPTVDEMNYSSVVFAGFVAIAVIYYYAQGRRTFTGPPTQHYKD